MASVASATCFGGVLGSSNASAVTSTISRSAKVCRARLRSRTPSAFGLKVNATKTSPSIAPLTCATAPKREPPTA